MVKDKYKKKQNIPDKDFFCFRQPEWQMNFLQDIPQDIPRSEKSKFVALAYPGLHIELLIVQLLLFYPYHWSEF